MKFQHSDLTESSENKAGGHRLPLAQCSHEPWYIYFSSSLVAYDPRRS